MFFKNMQIYIKVINIIYIYLKYKIKKYNHALTYSFQQNFNEKQKNNKKMFKKKYFCLLPLMYAFAIYANRIFLIISTLHYNIIYKSMGWL